MHDHLAEIAAPDPPTGHPHEIGAADLQAMYTMAPDPGALRDVVRRSREILGFFPAHNPRALEYPWIAATLKTRLKGERVLDVGAGVNVLPFIFADRGALITTLDNHPTTRDPNARRDWNEWGFLDYSLIDSRITSVRAPYEAWTAPEPFDVIYSVSVIEHVPRDVRLEWIKRFSTQLKPTGLLLLTVDLVRDSNRLWNLCEGKQIEDADAHGEFATLVDELRDAGFRDTQTNIQRGVPNCRVDIGFIRAQR